MRRGYQSFIDSRITDAEAASILKVNLTATTAPTATDDSSEDYAVGSVWVDVTNDIGYLCIDATEDAAIWEATTSRKYGLYTLSADQSTNIAVGNHIEWDTAAGTLGGLATGAGQADGIVTLSGGKNYHISSGFRLDYSAADRVIMEAYDRTNTQTLGLRSYNIGVNSGFNTAQQPIVVAVASPAANIDIDIRIVAVTGLSNIASAYSWLFIKEL